MKRNNPATYPTDMLQYIREEKEKTRVSLQESNRHMKQMTTDMFAPPQVAEGKAGTLLHLFNQGMAIYKGVMLGMTIVRSVRGLFRK
ncbi:MAG: hypothetical protein NC388_09215 [Clostridium sp.]|nr:hypothetical protein [Clostridium sp.]